MSRDNVPVYPVLPAAREREDPPVVTPSPVRACVRARVRSVFAWRGGWGAAGASGAAFLPPSDVSGAAAVEGARGPVGSRSGVAEFSREPRGWASPRR